MKRFRKMHQARTVTVLSSKYKFCTVEFLKTFTEVTLARGYTVFNSQLRWWQPITK